MAVRRKRNARRLPGSLPVDPFCATPPKRTGILLGFAPLMPADIREGIRRLAGALK